MSDGVKQKAIPAQQLLELCLGRPVVLNIREDNDPCIMAVRKGYSLSLRHLARTHKTALDSMHDLVTDEPPPGMGVINLTYHPTETHKGDVFTKALTPADFRLAIDRLGMRNAKLPPLAKRQKP